MNLDTDTFPANEVKLTHHWSLHKPITHIIFFAESFSKTNLYCCQTYPEAQLGKMGKTCMKILSLKDEEFYEGMGKYFVTLCQEAGYGNLLVQLGKLLLIIHLKSV